MNDTKAEVKAALQIMRAVAATIHDLKEVPSGVLYARLMGQIDLSTYNKIIELLKGAKLVSESNHLLTWTGPK